MSDFADHISRLSSSDTDGIFAIDAASFHMLYNDAIILNKVIDEG